jgi:hypothetical protein
VTADRAQAMLKAAARAEADGRLHATRATNLRRQGKHDEARAERAEADECFRKAKYATRAAFTENPFDPRHGTPHGYITFGCRCLRCSRAHSLYQREAPMRAAMKRMGA